MELLNQLDEPGLAGKVQSLSTKLSEGIALLDKLYDLDIDPRWMLVLQAMGNERLKPLTEVSETLQLSRPAMNKLIAELVKKRLVIEKKDKRDRRRNAISLTSKGLALVERMTERYVDVNAAMDKMVAETKHDLIVALGEWEKLLEAQSLLHRVQQERRVRESRKITIVPYQATHHQLFKSLNEAWITKHFELEQTDELVLNDPQAQILDKGGFIFVALYDGDPVGVCALVKLNDPNYPFELSKMAVDTKVQGKGIGWSLAQAVIETAKKEGAAKIYLETNTKLQPAVRLYQRLGFRQTIGRTSPYLRCNLQMELVF